MRNKLALSSFGLLLSSLVFQPASAKPAMADLMIEDFRPSVADFAMLDTPLSQGKRTTKAVALPSHLSSSSLATISGGSLVIDADSGELVRTDRDGKAIDRLRIGPDAAQLVVDREARKAYVTSRRSDEVVVVAYGKGLAKLSSIKTKAEPYGIALSPDKKSLLVTTVADKQLSSYDPVSGDEQWTMDIGPEARGVAISPKGNEAMVTFLNTAAVGRVSLEGDKRRLRFVALDRSVPAPPSFNPFLNPMPQFQQQRIIHSKSSFGPMDGLSTGTTMAAQIINPDEGRSFSRAAFAVSYITEDMAIVPHQESTPQMATNGGMENTGVYGGGGSFERPINHRLAFVSTSDSGFDRLAKATISTHQPRAVAYDQERDTLYLSGYGSDTVVAIGDATKATIHMKNKIRLGHGGSPCGPTAMDVADDGRLMAFCSLSRQVAAVDYPVKGGPKVAMSKAITESRFSSDAQRGRALFRMGDNARLSSNGVMACESCHPEGRTDGLSWKIGGGALNTPLLAGKVIGTHPFKWDGGDKDITTSLTHTVTRLGGSGISTQEAKAIAAYLGEMPKARIPTIKSKKAVTRGKKLFASKELGCATCHSGKLRTDRKMYELASDLEKVDTPALVGLAASAPYYHDGSATTLKALLLENGSIHGMGTLDSLNDEDVDDLIAYLETL